MAMVFNIRSARPAPGVPCARARYNEERHYLPWFRWKNKKTSRRRRQAPDGGTLPRLSRRPSRARQRAAADGAGEALKNKRRRGSRGGRGRKKRPAGRAVRAAEAAAETDPQRSRPARRRSAASGPSGRRPAPPAGGAPTPSSAAAAGAAAGCQARAADLGRHRRAARRGDRGRSRRRGLPRAARAALDRREHLPRCRRQRPARDGGGVRRDRAREERIPLRRRDRRARARGQAAPARRSRI